MVVLTSDHGEGFEPGRGRIHHGGRLHEDLTEVDARVRFKARNLGDLGSLKVDVNGAEIPAESLRLISHKEKGFLYA